MSLSKLRPALFGALLLGAALPAQAQTPPAAQAQTQPAAQGQTTSHAAKLPPRTNTPANSASSRHHAGNQMRMPRTAAGQNRELDQIGNKLLRETPRNPPSSSPATGGGLEPPTTH